LPMRRFIGDELSDKDKLFSGLEITAVA
jgi:hypothetical protein